MGRSPNILSIQFPPFVLLAGMVFIVLLLFGGGTRQGSFADVMPLFASIALLIVALRQSFVELAKEPFLRTILLGLLIAPLLQLVPLPHGLWSALPGRGHLQDIIAYLGGEATWRPISVAPEMTMRAFLSLLPPVSIFLTVSCLDERSRRIMVAILVAIAVLSVFVSALQVLSGGSSGLYFFEFTNPGKAVGFFANANHQAAFLYSVIPLCTALLAQPGLRLPVHPMIMLVLICAALALGLAMTGSRTAILLGLVSISYVFIVTRSVLRDMPRRYFLLLVAGLIAVVASIAGGVGLLAILRRFEEADVLSDARWTILRETWVAFLSYFPFGSGFGTFIPVYQISESGRRVMFQEVNRAHNDFLELLLEGGAVSAFLIGTFIAWLTVRLFRLVRRKFENCNSFEVAALLVVLLLCAHSLWDYPLRTTALSSVFALCLAFLLPAPEAHRLEAGRRRHRPRKSKASDASAVPV